MDNDTPQLISATTTAKVNARTYARVIAVFVLLTAVFEATLLALNQVGVFTPLASALASIMGMATGIAGSPATVSGQSVFLDSMTLQVNLECTGAMIIGAYAALVLAYPASWNERLRGLVWGILVISGINVVRLVVVALIAQFAPAYLGFLHDFLFQVVLVLVAAFSWMTWLSGLDRDA